VYFIGPDVYSLLKQVYFPAYMTILPLSLLNSKLIELIMKNIFRT